MDKREILVVTDNRNVKRYVTRSLASAGYVSKHCSWDVDQIEALLSPTCDMCILDSNGKRDVVVWLLRHLNENFKDVICLLVSHDLSNGFIGDLLVKENLNNLIAKHGGGRKKSSADDIIDETELIATCQKLFRREIFGLDKYLATWAIKIYDRPICGTGDKAKAVSELEDYLDLIDCYGAIRSSVLLVADELIMNAIYNAPHNELGLPKYIDRDRRYGLELLPAEEAVFRYACDGKYIAISVTDRFGSLARNVILKYLQRSFGSEPAKMEAKKGGAGLGLHMVFRSITQLTFNIEAGISTEVIALFYARRGGKAFRASGRSLNIFILQ